MFYLSRLHRYAGLRITFLLFIFNTVSVASADQAKNFCETLLKRGFELVKNVKAKKGTTEIRLYVKRPTRDYDGEYGIVEQAVVAIYEGRCDRIPGEKWTKTESADVRGSGSDLLLCDDGKWLIRSQTFGHGIMDTWLYRRTSSGFQEVRFKKDNFHRGAWKGCVAISPDKPPRNLDHSSQMLYDIVWQKATHRLHFSMSRRNWDVWKGEDFSFSAVYDADKNQFLLE